MKLTAQIFIKVNQVSFLKYSDGTQVILYQTFVGIAVVWSYISICATFWLRCALVETLKNWL
jgi:hypothetical protein